MNDNETTPVPFMITEQGLPVYEGHDRQPWVAPKLTTFEKIASRFFRIILGTINGSARAIVWMIGLWPQKTAVQSRDDARQEEARQALDEAITGLNEACNTDRAEAVIR